MISRRCARCGDPAHGKPEVTSPDRCRRGVSFSLSHSECARGGRRRDRRARRHRHRGRTPACPARRARGARARRRRRTPTGSICSPPRSSARVPRALDREGGLPQGHRRRHHACRCATCRSSPTVGPCTGFPSPPGVVARVAVEGYAVVHVERWLPPAVDARPAPTRTGRSTSSAAPRSARCSRPACSGCATRSSRRRDEEVAIVQDYSGDAAVHRPDRAAPRSRSSRGLDRDGAAVAAASRPNPSRSAEPE